VTFITILTGPGVAALAIGPLPSAYGVSPYGEWQTMRLDLRKRDAVREQQE
jgi:hypothetical protein